MLFNFISIKVKRVSGLEFNELILRSSEELKPFAFSLVRDHEEARDLCQETLYRAFAYRENYHPGTNIKAWLYAIMRNIFINQYRRNKRKKLVLEAFAASSDHYGISPEITVRMKEIYTAMHDLPQLLKTVAILYLEGYKYHEIAIALNEPLGTIKSRIHFARKMLQKQIER